MARVRRKVLVLPSSKTAFLMMDILRGTAIFILTTLTDFALVPPLFVLAQNRRHFQLYIGGISFFFAFCFSKN